MFPPYLCFLHIMFPPYFLSTYPPQACKVCDIILILQAKKLRPKKISEVTCLRPQTQGQNMTEQTWSSKILLVFPPYYLLLTFTKCCWQKLNAYYVSGTGNIKKTGTLPKEFSLEGVINHVYILRNSSIVEPYCLHAWGMLHREVVCWIFKDE